MNRNTRRRLLLTSWVAGLCAVLVLMVRLGGIAGTMPTTSGLMHPGTWSVEPMDAIAVVARVLVIVVVSYLLLATVLQLVPSSGHSRRSRSLTARLAPRFVLVRTAGVLVSTAPAMAAPTQSAASTQSGAPHAGAGAVMEVVDSSGRASSSPLATAPAPVPTTTTASRSTTTSTAPAPATTRPPSSASIPATSAPRTTVPTSPDLQRTIEPPLTPTRSARTSLPWARGAHAPATDAEAPSMTVASSPTSVPVVTVAVPASTGTPAALPASPAAEGTSAAPGSGDGPTGGTTVTATAADPTSTLPEALPPVAVAEHYAVMSGDHLWSIAAQTLERRTAAPPSDAEITRYWTALIETNRSALIDPDNPDLVRPGQVFVLPQS
ncbi:hypothetical protein BH10ACT3_BH10ACT3_07740 [soil metagenome]